jgi:hypothetical protein
VGSRLGSRRSGGERTSASKRTRLGLGCTSQSGSELCNPCGQLVDVQLLTSVTQLCKSCPGNATSWQCRCGFTHRAHELRRLVPVRAPLLLRLPPLPAPVWPV